MPSKHIKYRFSSYGKSILYNSVLTDICYHPRRYLSEARHSQADARRSRSSLETELKDIRERYLDMSLRYAEVEAQREELVMKLKAAKGGKRWF